MKTFEDKRARRYRAESVDAYDVTLIDRDEMTVGVDLLINGEWTPVELDWFVAYDFAELFTDKSLVNEMQGRDEFGPYQQGYEGIGPLAQVVVGLLALVALAAVFMTVGCGRTSVKFERVEPRAELQVEPALEIPKPAPQCDPSIEVELLDACMADSELRKILPLCKDLLVEWVI